MNMSCRHVMSCHSMSCLDIGAGRQHWAAFLLTLVAQCAMHTVCTARGSNDLRTLELHLQSWFGVGKRKNVRG